MKYSVIVPVYGVERYLEQCVESILAQSFKDFEIILVDDKSPDGCPALCDALAQKDERIRVIHKPVNEGLGFARNTGLAAARGQYVLFLDSDDRISEALLDTCDSALSDKTDMLVFGVEYVYEDKQGSVTLTEQAVPECFIADTPQKKAELFAQLNRAGAFPFAWNKIYRKEFLDASGIQFEKTKLIEDFLFNIALFGCAGRIDAIDKALYYYRRPAHETLVSKYAPEFFDLCKRKYRLEEDFLRSSNCLTPDFCDLIHLGYLKHLVSTVLKNRAKSAGLSQKEQKEKIREMMDDSLTAEVLSGFVPADIKYRLIRNAFYYKRVNFVLMYCIGIDFVQTNLLTLYRKILKR